MTRPTRTTRRDFLAGKRAAEALADVVIGEPTPLPPPAATTGVAPGTHLLSISREAMACLFEIVLDAAQYRHATDVAGEALDLVEALESQFTVYRDASEVAEINRRAGAEADAVEPGLIQLLRRAEVLFVV